jgi:hypothetical protein
VRDFHLRQAAAVGNKSGNGDINFLLAACTGKQAMHQQHAVDIHAKHRDIDMEATYTPGLLAQCDLSKIGEYLIISSFDIPDAFL